MLHQGCSRTIDGCVPRGRLSQEAVGTRDSALRRLEPSELGLTGAQLLPCIQSLWASTVRKGQWRMGALRLQWLLSVSAMGMGGLCAVHVSTSVCTDQP